MITKVSLINVIGKLTVTLFNLLNSVKLKADEKTAINDYKKFFEEVNKWLDRNIRRLRQDVKRIKIPS